jgi:hypothetical protein
MHAVRTDRCKHGDTIAWSITILRSVDGEHHRVLGKTTRFVLLKNGPRGMKFMLVDGDGGCGRQNDRLVTAEETSLALHAHLTHELVLDASSILERESRWNGFRYSNVERNILAVQHAKLVGRLPEIDGTLPNKVIERILWTTRECFNLAKFDPNVLCLDALGAHAYLDGPFDGCLGSVRSPWGNTRISLDKVDIWRRTER